MVSRTWAIVYAASASSPVLAQCDATVLADWISPPGVSYPGSLIIDGDVAYFAQGGYLHILSIDDPAAITLLGVYQSPGTFTGGVAFSGHLVYFAAELSNGQRGVQIVDVSDPTTPSLAGELDPDVVFSIPTEYVDLEVAGGKLLALDLAQGVYVFDLTDPTDPQLIPDFPNSNSEQGLFDVWVGDDVAILGNTDTDLQIFDTTTSSGLPLIGEAESGFFFYPDVQQITVRRGIAYISGSNKSTGIHAFDVSEPTQPHFLYTISLGRDTSSLVFRGDVAIVSRYRDSAGVHDPISLLAFDLTDPADPTELSRDGTVFHQFFRQSGDRLLAIERAGDADRIVMYDAALPCLPCSEADLSDPRGLLDFSDVAAFLTGFAAELVESDMAEPYRDWNFSDVLAFLTAFAAGCP